MIEDIEKFFEEIEKLSLPELELRIKDRFKIFQRSELSRDEELNMCLSHRKKVRTTDLFD
jgi:hypothetical protein